MLNILWVEDQATNEKKNQWFNGRAVQLITDFSQAEQIIKSDLNQYDIFVLDIDLRDSERTAAVEKYANSLKLEVLEFLKRAGINLYFMLLENGFPKDRIVFLTANANAQTSLVNDLKQAFDCGDDDKFNKTLEAITVGFGDEEKTKAYKFIDQPDGSSEDDVNALCNYIESLNKVNEDEGNNTYELFRKAAMDCRIIDAPKPCLKGTDQLDIELKKHEVNKYLVLRRGIIEGCNYLESSTTSPELKEYLFGLKKYLPIKEPLKNEKQSVYLHLVRAIVHDWDDKGHKIPDRKTNPVGNTLGYLLRTTRNWLTHDSLLSNFDEKTIAFVFLINIRMLDNLGSPPLADFEYKLLSVFSKSNDSENEIICNLKKFYKEAVETCENNEINFINRFYSQMVNEFHESKLYSLNYTNMIFRLFMFSIYKQTSSFPKQANTKNPNSPYLDYQVKFVKHENLPLWLVEFGSYFYDLAIDSCKK